MNMGLLSKALKICGGKQFHIKANINYTVVHQAKFAFTPLKIKHNTFRKIQGLLGSPSPQGVMQKCNPH